MSPPQPAHCFTAAAAVTGPAGPLIVYPWAPAPAAGCCWWCWCFEEDVRPDVDDSDGPEMWMEEDEDATTPV
jgi:hypothetical protein